MWYFPLSIKYKIKNEKVKKKSQHIIFHVWVCNLKSFRFGVIFYVNLKKEIIFVFFVFFFVLLASSLFACIYVTTLVMYLSRYIQLSPIVFVLLPSPCTCSVYRVMMLLMMVMMIDDDGDNFVLNQHQYSCWIFIVITR